MEIILGGSKGLSTFVDDEDYRTFDLGSYNWSPQISRHSTVYVKAHKNNKTILLHRLILGLLDSPRFILVDHIDHNGLNNCKDNLRVTDNSGNNANSRKRLSETSSLYKGVTRHSNNKSKPWETRITLSGKRKYLGYYRTQEEAATAYNKAAIELFGTMAFLNILPDQK